MSHLRDSKWNQRGHDNGRSSFDFFRLVSTLREDHCHCYQSGSIKICIYFCYHYLLLSLLSLFVLSLFPPSERTTATAINQVQLRFLKNHNIGISGFHHYVYFCCCCLTVIVGLCRCCSRCFRLQRKNGHSDHSGSSEIRYPLGGGIERNHWRKKSEWKRVKSNSSCGNATTRHTRLQNDTRRQQRTFRNSHFLTFLVSIKREPGQIATD